SRTRRGAASTLTPEVMVNHPLTGEVAGEFGEVGCGPCGIAGKPLAPRVDADGLFENGERCGIDALAALTAEARQSSSQLVRDAADRELLGHACMIALL